VLGCADEPEPAYEMTPGGVVYGFDGGLGARGLYDGGSCLDGDGYGAVARPATYKGAGAFASAPYLRRL